MKHRCHDRQCGTRHRCERWRQRQDTDRHPLHAMTLKPGWIPHTTACNNLIRHQMTLGEIAEHGPAGWLIAGWLLGIKPSRVGLTILTRPNTPRQ